MNGIGALFGAASGSAVTAFSLVKAKVTGERYDGGENETVEL